MTCNQVNAAGKTILSTEKREWSVLEIHSETRDMFSTLVPSGGETTKEPLHVFSVCIQCMYSVYCLEMLKGNTHHSCHFWKGNRANASVSNMVHYILIQFLQSVYFFYLKYEDRNCTVTLHIF